MVENISDCNNALLRFREAENWTADGLPVYWQLAWTSNLRRCAQSELRGSSSSVDEADTDSLALTLTDSY